MADKPGDLPVGVEKVSFLGWDDCYKLSNDSAELIVVPAIGRAMMFRKLDDQNVFKIMENTAGKTRKKTEKYISYGGLYSWVAPQSA